MPAVCVRYVKSCVSVMWSETVGLRTRPVSDQNKSDLVLILILVLRFWRCVVKHGLVTLVVIIIFKDTETFQVSLFCAWNITTYCNTASATLSVVCSLGLGLVILVLYAAVLVLVLRIWSCLHHWRVYGGDSICLYCRSRDWITANRVASFPTVIK